jgi:peroxiredoxin
MTIRTGDAAAPFTLPAKPGEQVDVGRYIGEDIVVLAFFPLAFSSVCATEMNTLGDAWSRWSELGARVFGISVDSPFVTERFRQVENVPFPLLSDFNKEVTTRYGVLEEDYFGLKGVAKRAVFVIGRDGKVAYDWVSDDSGVEPNYGEVEAAVCSA